MELASTAQIRMSLLRWALVTVPLVMLLGFLAGQLSGSGADNGWYRALDKPAITPPGWVFPVAWSILYAMMGFAIAIILNARGAALRGVAIGLFCLQFALNLGWSPVFFGMRQPFAALILIIAILLAALATTFVFGRVRSLAAWLMVPYLVWLCFATMLNLGIVQRNPGGAPLYAPAASAQI